MEPNSSRLHVCPHCGKSFARRSYLCCHLTAHRSPALQCDACHRQFGRVDSFRRHRCPAASTTDFNSKSSPDNFDVSITPVRRRHTCPSCQKTYSRRETLLQHVVRHHKELVDNGDGQQNAINAHPCSVCHRVFASALSLHNHEVLVHGGTAVADSIQSDDSCQFTAHINADDRLCPSRQQDHTDETLPTQQQNPVDTDFEPTQNDSQYMCDTENDVTLSQQSGFDTVAAKSCMCQYCGRTFSGSGWLRRHVTAVHTYESRTEPSSAAKQSMSTGHVCPMCGKSLASVGNLNKHLLTHGPRHETCSVCGRQFHQRATLRQHLRDVHAPPGSFTVECTMCGLRMRSRNSLYSHIARFHSTSVPPHVCATCGRTFYQRSNLRKHEWTHSDAAMYFCPDCPRQLRTAERLRRHQTWHHQGAQFTCADCGRCFVQPSDLRRHIAFRHPATKRTYRCCYCGVCCRHHQVCCCFCYSSYLASLTGTKHVMQCSVALTAFVIHCICRISHIVEL